MKFFEKYRLIFSLIFSCSTFLHAQKTLQIIKDGLGSFKKYEFYCGNSLAYKLNGDKFYKHCKIVNMSDSLILFSNDSIVNLKNIKAFKFKRGNNAMGGVSKFFLKGGIGYLGLDVITNLVYQNSFKADPRAFCISACCFAGYLIYNRLNTKNLRVTDNVSLSVLDINFQKLK